MIKGLPQRLKFLREKYNLSQKQVSDRIGVSASIISAYELGNRTPSTEIILALSHLYHCSTDYLLGNDNSPVNIVIDTNGLSDEQLRIVQELIETMKYK